MTTTTTSTALVPAGPAFSEQERLALAGFVAGHSGRTREAYGLDLRQFAAWCHRHQLACSRCATHGRDPTGRARARMLPLVTSLVDPPPQSDRPRRDHA
jgi:hypothetical protein